MPVVTLLAAAVLAQSPHSTCLAFISENLAKGNGNWYTYYKISERQITFRAGDKLEYDVFVDPRNPSPKGGLDVDFTDGSTALRDLGLSDQNSLRVHGDALLGPAAGQWYHREIRLDEVIGKTSSRWNAVFEGDEPGVYVQFLDNILVLHADRSTSPVYEGGASETHEIVSANGYTNFPACEPVDKSELNGPALATLVSRVMEHSKRLRVVTAIQADIQAMAALLPDNAHVKKAQMVIAGLETNRDVTDAQIQQAMSAAKAELMQAKPALAGHMGFLVGYAHIDLQWLWEWQEAMVASHDTFRQAIKFMDEIPGFRFSQSSSAHYKVIEDNYPDLFAKIKQKVASGQIEIVGGRVCEADTNVIGPESHARQFLYGQRYFRERFGKTALVGWEPDTFGHTIQMPQMLQLSGCKYYYFGRAGKSQPIFWWKGLDGSQVLAFDDAAAGSWYNSSLSDQQFHEMASVAKRTGAKETMIVYGVGNHGGGPTREELQEAQRWKAAGYLPSTGFSTAGKFFDSLAHDSAKNIPTIDQELNTVFPGCYTTHCEIKQSMREAETWTSSAEAAAAVASLKGFKYPALELRSNWEMICTNQHHDSMGGSGIHSPYEKTKLRLDAITAQDKTIIASALETLVQRVTPKKGGLDVLVFNPLGWKRSAWCEAYLVQSGWNPDQPLDAANAVAVAPDGSHSAVELLDAPSRKARFWAANVPGFGYKVFHITTKERGERGEERVLGVRNAGYTIETDRFVAEFDPEKGFVKRLVDKRSGRTIDAAGLGRIVAHYEQPQGMSAWELGKIAKIEALKPVSSETQSNAGSADVSFIYRMPSVNNASHDTVVKQTFHVESGSDQISCDIDFDWNQIGSSKTAN